MLQQRRIIMTRKRTMAMIMALIFVLFGTNMSNALEVCGLIEDGTVWGTADSPIEVTCDLNIAGLTIEPGVEVLLNGNYEIVVNGYIHSQGEEGSEVVFKPADTNTEGWAGFYFVDTIPGSEFNWTIIEGANNSAFRLVRSTPLFEYCTIRNNSAVYGGGMNIEIGDTDLVIRNCSFEENYASKYGGAIYLTGIIVPGGARLVVEDSSFSLNNVGTTSLRDSTSGGAIYSKGNMRIVGTVFTENEARAYTIYALYGRYTQGGAIYILEGNSEIIDTELLYNGCRMGAHSQTPDDSFAFGGAIYIHTGILHLQNSLLAENFLYCVKRPTYRGSGIYVRAADIYSVNSTFAYNTGHAAIYNYGGNVDILNSILFYNNNDGLQVSGTATATYSDIQTEDQSIYEGEGNINYGPVFNEDYLIVPPSPCIDAGNPRSVYYDGDPPGLGLGTEVNDMGFTGGHYHEIVCFYDNDNDGYYQEGGICGQVDCDDSNPGVHPGAREFPFNGIDDDCNPDTPEPWTPASTVGVTDHHSISISILTNILIMIFVPATLILVIRKRI
jgi:predicted outer membrane repeat protein